MLYLLFAVLSSVGVIHLLKLAGHRNIPRFPLFVVNYAVAFLAGFVRADQPTSLVGLPLGYWLLAVTVGVAFVLAFFALSRAVTEAGPSLATTVSRLAIAIPVAVSVTLFGEQASPGQLLGILLTLLVLPLSSPESPLRGGLSLRRSDRTAFLWLLLLFLLFGFNDVAFKMREEFYRSLDERAFTVILFGTSLLMSVAITVKRRERIGYETALLGVALGAVNYSSAIWLIRALQVLPAFQVYPVNSIGIIVLATISSVLVWRERPKGHHYLFYLGAAGAVYLLS
mgnify:CR=1 FL=1